MWHRPRATDENRGIQPHGSRHSHLSSHFNRSLPLPCIRRKLKTCDNEAVDLNLCCSNHILTSRESKLMPLTTPAREHCHVPARMSTCQVCLPFDRPWACSISIIMVCFFRGNLVTTMLDGWLMQSYYTSYCAAVNVLESIRESGIIAGKEYAAEQWLKQATAPLHPTGTRPNEKLPSSLRMPYRSQPCPQLNPQGWGKTRCNPLESRSNRRKGASDSHIQDQHNHSWSQ